MPENNHNSSLNREQAKHQLIHSAVVTVAALFVFCFACVAWFVNNTRVNGQSTQISAAGTSEFALATVGTKSQGAYDSLFGLSAALQTETIGDVEYYIASSNSSCRVSSGKNFNNYLDNADLRPGNRGNFDLYIICYTANRNVTLQPIFSLPDDNKEVPKGADQSAAAEFLKGHILLFAGMDDKGMYTGNIDLTEPIQPIQVTLNDEEKKGSASQKGSERFPWGELVYSDSQTAVYRLPIFWVWPDQFGNFIYTGNAYNKNLFAVKGTDYNRFIAKMSSDTGYKQFFDIPDGAQRRDIALITDPDTDFKTATEIYDQYSSWYNSADEKIGECISFIRLGFEIPQTN